MGARTQAPTRLSPLHAIHRALGAQFERRAGWRMPQLYGTAEDEERALRERVGWVDLSANGKLIVKGAVEDAAWPDTLGSAAPAAGRLSPVDLSRGGTGRGYLARLTADEYLVVTPPGAEDGALAALNGNRAFQSAAVLDLTAGLAGLLLAGPRSAAVLSKLCALPFADGAFPERHVAQGRLAQVHATIVRRDAGALTAFELYVERPYGVYVWQAVTDAGAEFGIAACGRRAKQALEL